MVVNIVKVPLQQHDLDKVHRSDMVVQETAEETYDHGVTDVGL